MRNVFTVLNPSDLPHARIKRWKKVSKWSNRPTRNRFAAQGRYKAGSISPDEFVAQPEPAAGRSAVEIDVSHAADSE
jgi:hypothetical protein